MITIWQASAVAADPVTPTPASGATNDAAAQERSGATASALIVPEAAPSLVADAAQARDDNAIRALIAGGANVKAPQADGTTALHWAARWDDLELADVLLRAGADPAAATRVGATPLFLASQNGSRALIARLLDAGADANASFLAFGETPLMFAARTGSLDAVRLLLDRGAEVEATESRFGTSALMWAAEQNQLPVVTLLLERGADVNRRSAVRPPPPFQISKGATPPVKMAKTPQPPGTASAPPKPESRLSGGLSPIIFAAREGYLDLARLLLAHGATVNAMTADLSTPLLVAVQNGHYDMARLLVERGADVSAVNAKGWSPLYLAVKNRSSELGTLPVPPVEGTYELIELLLARGANVNVRINSGTDTRASFRGIWLNEAGATPFFRASFTGDLQVMRLLLAHGADPRIPTGDGTTPLMALAGVGYSDVGIRDYGSAEQSLEAMRLLLDAGVPINAQNEQGLTALHGAAHKGFLPAIELLVARGADLTIKDNGSDPTAPGQGLLALNWAEGVSVGGGQSSIYREDAVALIERLMKEKNISVDSARRVKGGQKRVAQR